MHDVSFFFFLSFDCFFWQLVVPFPKRQLLTPKLLSERGFQLQFAERNVTGFPYSTVDTVAFSKEELQKRTGPRDLLLRSYYSVGLEDFVPLHERVSDLGDLDVYMEELLQIRGENDHVSFLSHLAGLDSDRDSVFGFTFSQPFLKETGDGTQAVGALWHFDPVFAVFCTSLLFLYLQSFSYAVIPFQCAGPRPKSILC
jgi:hypothetical protein